MTAPGLTPSQTVGPFFHIGLLRGVHNILAGPQTAGERIRIEGRVFDGARAPLADAVVEIWQADAAGHYHHPLDRGAAAHDPAFTGFGRCGTDESGSYWFDTVKPGRVPYAGQTLQAPHISVAVFARGLLNHLWTRLYFEKEDANEADPVLRRVPEHRRATLISRRMPAGNTSVYQFDIILQGDGETVFFER
jgi:protocatechuate 3,4-dioxygenase alpha subunit